MSNRLTTNGRVGVIRPVIGSPIQGQKSSCSGILGLANSVVRLPKFVFPKEAMRHGYGKSMFRLVTCMSLRVLLSDSNVPFLPISNLDIWYKSVVKSFPGVHKFSV